jgi:Flp pilus assembly protein TadG
MDIKNMAEGNKKPLYQSQQGQSMIEFALILPLMVLIIVGIFELGRAFFAYIAITNAAREGARIYTFTPNITTYDEIIDTVRTEMGTATLVDPDNIVSIEIACGTSYDPVLSDTDLATCPTEQPIRVTVTYSHELILGVFFTEPLILVRSAEMMKP